MAQSNAILRVRIEDRVAHIKTLSENLAILTTRLINQSVGDPELRGQVREATRVLELANSFVDLSHTCLRRICPKHKGLKGGGKGNQVPAQGKGQGKG